VDKDMMVPLTWQVISLVYQHEFKQKNQELCTLHGALLELTLNKTVPESAIL